MSSPFKSCVTKEYFGHKKKAHCVAWSCSGAKLASGSVDQTVRLWTVDTARARRRTRAQGHQDAVDQLRWDPLKPDVLGTASADKTVRIWDARTASARTPSRHAGENINLPVARRAAHRGGRQGRQHLVRRDAQPQGHQDDQVPDRGQRDGLGGDGTALFLTTGSGTVEIYRYDELLKGADVPAAHTLYANTANCYCIEFDPKGEHFACGGADAMVSVWSVKELACVRTCARLEWPVRTLSFSYDGQYLASGSEDPLIDVASVATGEQAHAIPTSAPMNSVSWHPSSRYWPTSATTRTAKDEMRACEDLGSAGAARAYFAFFIDGPLPRVSAWDWDCEALAVGRGFSGCCRPRHRRLAVTLRMPEIEEIDEDDLVLDATEERKAAMAGPSTKRPLRGGCTAWQSGRIRDLLEKEIITREAKRAKRGEGSAAEEHGATALVATPPPPPAQAPDGRGVGACPGISARVGSGQEVGQGLRDAKGH